MFKLWQIEIGRNGERKRKGRSDGGNETEEMRSKGEDGLAREGGTINADK